MIWNFHLDTRNKREKGKRKKSYFQQRLLTDFYVYVTTNEAFHEWLSYYTSFISQSIHLLVQLLVVTISNPFCTTPYASGLQMVDKWKMKAHTFCVLGFVSAIGHITKKNLHSFACTKECGSTFTYLPLYQTFSCIKSQDHDYVLTYDGYCVWFFIQCKTSFYTKKMFQR